MSDNQDPWSRKPQHDPTDLVALFKRFFTQSSSSGGGSGKVTAVNGKLVGIVIVVLLGLWALTGIYVVSPQQESVVLRFGAYVKTVGEGPHWIPRFIDQQTTLNVAQISTFPFSHEMLTKDENIVSVALAVQYRILNPKDYLYNVADSEQSLHQATSSALRQVVGGMTLDSILTTGRQELRDQVSQQLNDILDLYHTGLIVTDVTLQPAKPPEAVTQAFDDAIKAREDEQTYINQAEAYARQVESRAQGQAARLIQEGTAYQQQTVLQSQGDTARYLALLKPYLTSPYVTEERLYMDALSNVLSQTTNIMVDNTKGSPVFYLPLDQMLKNKAARVSKMTSSSSATDAQYSDSKIASNNTYSNGDDFSHPRYSFSQQGGQS